MLTNCLAECAHLTITVSEIERDICEKIGILSSPLHSTPLLRGFPSEYRHSVWYGKTRMVSLPDGEKILKISLFVLAQLTNVTDAQTDRWTPGDSIYSAYAYASRGKNCLCVTVVCTVIMVHKGTSSSYRSVDCIRLQSCLV